MALDGAHTSWGWCSRHCWKVFQSVSTWQRPCCDHIVTILNRDNVDILWGGNKEKHCQRHKFSISEKAWVMQVAQPNSKTCTFPLFGSPYTFEMKYQFLPKHLNILHDHHLISWLVEHCILGVKKGARWNYMGDGTQHIFCIYALHNNIRDCHAAFFSYAHHCAYPHIGAYIRDICAYMQYSCIYARIFAIGHWPCPCGKMRHWPSPINMHMPNQYAIGHP